MTTKITRRRRKRRRRRRGRMGMVKNRRGKLRIVGGGILGAEIRRRIRIIRRRGNGTRKRRIRVRRGRIERGRRRRRRV